MAWDDVLVAHVSKYTAAIHNEIINQIKARILHSLSTAENDFLVGAPTGGSFVKKTLAEVKTILGLGSAAYTASTAYEPANSNIQSHIGSTSNPHGVTAAQAGALPVAGGTISGDLTVTQTITGVRNRINVPVINLGAPTIEEMTLIPGEMTNKIAFRPPDLQEESVDGTTWLSSSKATAGNLKSWVIGNGQSYFTSILLASELIANGKGFYRLTWDITASNFCNDKPYVYLNYFYAYLITGGNNLNIKLEGYNAGRGWEEICNGDVCSWPGHAFVNHTPLMVRDTYASPGYWYDVAYGLVRVTFAVENVLYNNNIDLGSVSWFGGFPLDTPEAFSYDTDKNVTFPAGITAGGVIYPEKSASAPTATESGIYYDTTLHKLRVYGASGWETVDST